MLLWYAKASSTDNYVQVKTPSSYKIDWEDLDANSYRSISTGTLIDTVIVKKMSKLYLSYKYLSASELNEILTIINNNPIYVKALNPLFEDGHIEATFRCSKASCEMLETGDYSLSFNLVQKKKVSGQ